MSDPVEVKKRRLMFVAPEGFGGAATPSYGEAGDRQRRYRARLMGSETVDWRCFGSAHALSKAVFKALFNEVMYDLRGLSQARACRRPRQVRCGGNGWRRYRRSGARGKSKP